MSDTSDIGQKLKEARIEKGYTLDDLQQITKIQKRYLIAIEDDDFAALAGDFYVRALIRPNAETVDLNADELLAGLGDAAGNTSAADNADASKPQAATTRREILREQEGSSKPDGLEKFLSYLPTIIIVVVVVAILGSIYIVAWGNHKKNANQQIEDKTTSVVSSSSHKKAKKSSSGKSATKSSQKIKYVAGTSYTYTLSHAKKQNKIDFKVSGSSAWNAVTADGSQVWQGTLDNQSHVVTLPAGTKEVKINIGNSSATELTINGKKFDYRKQGNSQQVRTITIQINGASGASDSSASSSSQGTSSSSSSLSQQSSNSYSSSSNQSSTNASQSVANNNQNGGNNQQTTTTTNNQ